MSAILTAARHSEWFQQENRTTVIKDNNAALY